MKQLAVCILFLTACGKVPNTPSTDRSAASYGRPEPISAPSLLRVMEGNISSGNKQSYDPGEGQRIFEGLGPDIVTLQEFNYGDNSDTTIRGFVDDTFGSNFSYQRGAGQIPNGVISRFPIVTGGEWTDPAVSNRGFTWAEVALPNGPDLWVVSVHLLTTSAAHREDEATALLADVQQLVPTNGWVVLGGDFNTVTRDEAMITTLSAAFATKGPYPADQSGNDNTSINRNHPHDWILAGTAFAPQQTEVLIGENNFNAGLVVDTRVYTPISDITPALATDSGSSGMQHMAVVKDFFY